MLTWCSSCFRTSHLTFVGTSQHESKDPVLPATVSSAPAASIRYVTTCSLPHMMPTRLPPLYCYASLAPAASDSFTTFTVSLGRVQEGPVSICSPRRGGGRRRSQKDPPVKEKKQSMLIVQWMPIRPSLTRSRYSLLA